jgi:hypothetical protein
MSGNDLVLCTVAIRTKLRTHCRRYKARIEVLESRRLELVEMRLVLEVHSHWQAVS